MAKKGFAKIGDYKLGALMVMASAREVKDRDVVFAGTGLPMVAIMAAQYLHAPNAVLIYEAGSVDGRSISIPSSVADPRALYKSSQAAGVADVMETMQRGWVDLGYLGGAEIDMYGNVNATSMGDYNHPSKRFPGSGGNVDINSLSRRTVFIMVQQKRRFTEQVDYITSPGWRVKSWKNGKLEWVSRQDCYKKMFRGGPAAVITDMAVFRFDKKTGLMYLDTVHPGRTVQDVKDNVGFDLDVSRVNGETPPPTYEELDLLYNKIDPEGIFLP
ncbi:acyl CoA--acetate/3-ketoacid CoA transferase subunit beta [bacterium]|nr:MAG: acyl CoA--acetate/3-ketoacid CoA transferase subunit beta [bacterium]